MLVAAGVVLKTMLLVQVLVVLVVVAVVDIMQLELLVQRILVAAEAEVVLPKVAVLAVQVLLL